MNIIDRNENRKARKDHSCDWCEGIIKKDELYDWQKITSDDYGIYEWKAHKHCVEVASYYDMFDDWEDGLSQLQFSDSICDIFNEKDFGKDNLELSEVVIELYKGIKEE